MKVYLCGGINGLSDAACNDWRAYAKARLPDTLDPMRRDYRGIESAHVELVVGGDIDDIYESGAVLANCVRPSWGTAMEIRVAWQLNKPVHAFVEPGTTPSPWLLYHCTIHTSLDAAIDAILAEQAA
jgi:hypothetical protein